MRVLHYLTAAYLLCLECSWILGTEDRLHCLKTNNHNDVQKLRLELIEQELLLRLNLDKAPENPDPELVKKYKESARDEYEAVSSAQKKQDDATKPCVDLDRRTSKLSVLFPQQVVPSPVPGTSNALFDTLQMTFKLDLSDREDVTNAELRLYKEVVHQNSTIKERVDIFLLTDSENYYNTSIVTHGTAGIVRADRNGYVIFNMQSTINKWKGQNPSFKGELKLKITIKRAYSAGYSPIPTIQFASDNATTQLVIMANLNKPEITEVVGELKDLDTDSPYYKKRASKGSIECALHPLTVNLRQDLNITWILYPETLTLNYCSGLCGRVNAGTRHGQYLARRASVLDNPLAASTPCCVPNGYASETITLAPIRGSNGTIVEKLEDITITSCVCR